MPVFDARKSLWQTLNQDYRLGLRFDGPETKGHAWHLDGTLKSRKLGVTKTHGENSVSRLAVKQESHSLRYPGCEWLSCLAASAV